ncbi:MAG: dihydroneopterin aldolase [Cellvibrionales bacterium]|nr:dihydroneopterin aldolase [Cellvibrionales bacterium]
MKNSDSIFIRQLEVSAFVGVYDHEKAERQPIMVDLELGVDLSLAAISNDLNDTVDYAKVADTVVNVAQSQHYELIEHLAQHCFDALFDRFQVEWISIRIAKPHAIKNAQVSGIQMLRHRA